jgi:SAM-dependent methyltransferase
VDPVWLAEEAFRRADDRMRLNEIGEMHSGKHLIDVGCNCGFFLDEARTRGYETYGVEIAAGPAEYARTQFNLNVTTSQFEVADFKGIPFDIVTMWHVLEHMPQPNVTLQKTRDILVDGGLLAIEVPRFDAWSVNLLGARHRHIGFGHAAYYTKRVLRRLLENNGFRVLTCRNVGRTLSLPWLAVRMSQSLGPLRAPVHSLVRNHVHRHFGRIYLNLGDIMRIYAIKDPTASLS